MQLRRSPRNPKRKADEMEVSLQELAEVASGLTPSEIEAAAVLRPVEQPPKAPAENKMEAEQPSAPAEIKDEKNTPKSDLLKTLEKAALELYALSQKFRSAASGIQKNIETANELLIMAADLGFSEAEQTLGRAYILAQYGFTKNEKKGTRLLQSAANKGNAIAQALLGLCYKHGRHGFLKDEPKAFHWFKLAEAQGNDTAQFEFGVAYQHGIAGFPQDGKKAVHYYTLAKNQGNHLAEVRFAFCYEKGIGVVQNLQEAVTLYLMAATSGIQIAQTHIGICFQNGIGVPQSDKQAFEHYSSAAKQIPFAKVKLGLYYLKGIEGFLDKDPAEATRLFNEVRASDEYNPLEDLPPGADEISSKVRFFELSEVALIKEHFPPIPALSSTSSASKAEKEDSKDVAMIPSRETESEIPETKQESDISKMQVKAAKMLCTLAKKFADGSPEIQKNSAKSMELCTLAIELGSTDAETELGIWHNLGLNGLTVNRNKAAELFRSAATKGNAQAQHRLGNYTLYRLGGLKTDEKAAIIWYQKAANQGYSAAYYSLGICHEIGTGVAKNLKEAFKLYLLADINQCSAAKIHLGICFQTGRGTTQNHKKAFEYYQQAAKEFPFAKVKLALYYLNGIEGFLDKNPAKAEKLFNEVKASTYKPLDALPTESHEGGPDLARSQYYVFEKSEVALIKQHFTPVPAQVSPPSRFMIFAPTAQIQQPVPQQPIAQQPSSSSAVVKNGGK